MRPQLNVSLDEYPELPEKLRKFCKARKYKINDFVARVLNEAIDKEVSQMAGNTVELTVSDALTKEVSEIRARLEEFNRQINNLNDALVENLPQLNNDVWLMKKAIFESESPLIKLSERVENLEKAQDTYFNEIEEIQKAVNKLSARG